MAQNHCQVCGGFVTGEDVCPVDGGRGMFTNVRPIAPPGPVPHGAPPTPSPLQPTVPAGQPQSSAGSPTTYPSTQNGEKS